MTQFTLIWTSNLPKGPSLAVIGSFNHITWHGHGHAQQKYTSLTRQIDDVIVAFDLLL